MSNQNMKLPKFIAIVKFSKKRWVFNFKHFRKNGRFHVMVNRKPKKPYSRFFYALSKELPAVTGVLKPSSQLH